MKPPTILLTSSTFNYDGVGRASNFMKHRFSIGLIIIISVILYLVYCYVQAYQELLSDDINCPNPIQNESEAIEFGKEYATKEPDFVKITSAISSIDLRRILNNDIKCCSARVEEYYQGKAAVWSIVIADKSMNDLTFMLIEATACRRKIEAHW